MNFQVYSESDTVAQFRAAINNQFGRFNAFYDATNNAMTNYRITHVDELITVFNPMMDIFGQDIEYVRNSRAALNAVISDVLQLLGGKKYFETFQKILIANF